MGRRDGFGTNSSGRIGYEKVVNLGAYEGASHNNWLIEVRTIVPLAP